MQGFVSIISSNTGCFLRTSHYYPTQLLTFCMLDFLFGHLQDSILHLLAASLLHALATHLRVSRDSQRPPLFAAPGN